MSSEFTKDMAGAFALWKAQQAVNELKKSNDLANSQIREAAQREDDRYERQAEDAANHAQKTLEYQHELNEQLIEQHEQDRRALKEELDSLKFVLSLTEDDRKDYLVKVEQARMEKARVEKEEQTRELERQRLKEVEETTRLKRISAQKKSLDKRARLLNKIFDNIGVKVRKSTLQKFNNIFIDIEDLHDDRFNDPEHILALRSKQRPFIDKRIIQINERKSKDDQKKAARVVLLIGVIAISMQFTIGIKIFGSVIGLVFYAITGKSENDKHIEKQQCVRDEEFIKKWTDTKKLNSELSELLEELSKFPFAIENYEDLSEIDILNVYKKIFGLPTSGGPPMNFEEAHEVLFGTSNY